MKNNLLHNKQDGSAVITALLIVAVISITVTWMFTRQNIAIETTKQVLNAEQAQHYAIGVEYWAIDTLQKLLSAEQSVISAQTYPIVLNKTAIPGGTFEGRIYDLHARYDLNQLHKTGRLPMFTNMLQVIVPEIKLTQAERIGKSIIAWMNKDSSNNEAYLRASPAYVEPNQPMVSVSELRLMAGMDQAIYARLLPHVIALGLEIPLNVNTASPAALLSIGKGLSLSDVATIISYRESEGGFLKRSDFMALPEMQTKARDANITTKSEFYLAQAIVELDGIRLVHYSILNIKVNSTEEITATLLSRSRGTL